MDEHSSVFTCAGAATAELQLPGQIRAREARGRTVATVRIEPKICCSAEAMGSPRPLEHVGSGVGGSHEALTTICRF